MGRPAATDRKRPFTTDMSRMIIEDFKKGRPLSFMCGLYNLDKEHLKNKLLELTEKEIIKPDMWGCEAKGPIPANPLKGKERKHGKAD